MIHIEDLKTIAPGSRITRSYLHCREQWDVPQARMAVHAEFTEPSGTTGSARVAWSDQSPKNLLETHAVIAAADAVLTWSGLQPDDEGE